MAADLESLHFVLFLALVWEVVMVDSFVLNATEPSVSTAKPSPVTGTDLFCYECKENYKKEYDPLNSPCRHNVTSVSLRQCGPEHRYCQTDKEILSGWSMYSISRGCTSECLYGCKFNGFALTLQKCVSCCRTPRCNTDGGAWALQGGALGAWVAVAMGLVELLLDKF